MKNWRKTVTFISTFALLLNSLSAPITVLAQTTTPEPTLAPIESPTLIETSTTSPEAIVEPTSTPTATPDATPADISTPTPEETPVASDLVTPVSTDQPTETQAPESNPTVQGPPETSSPIIQSTNNQIITPTPEIPKEIAKISTTIVTPNIFPETVQDNSWFKLITDKLDYSPTEKAIVTGTNFAPNKTYSITVSSTDDPATSTTVDITTDGSGSFTYYYQLDGNYRPNYLIEVKYGEVIVASSTFTDSKPSGVTVTGQNPNPDPSWPGCNFHCDANDTTITKLELVKPDGSSITSCNQGDDVTAKIVGTFNNNSGSPRYSAVLLGDVYEGTTLKQHFNTSGVDGQCIINTLPVGISVQDVATLQWKCGETLTVKNLVLSWDTGASTCGGFFSDPKCAQRGTKCYGGTSFEIPVITPVICGDGAINPTSEQCDNGLQNGVACTPNYGSSCNYCSNSCQTQTVNGPYCGDNIKNGAEECDGTNGVSSGYTCSQSCSLIRNTGTITVDKVTVPSGDQTSFDFSVISSETNTNETFTLANQTTPWTMTLPTGVYSVSEGTLPQNWTLSDTSCISSQGTPISGNFDLDDGENVTCTFTNTKKGTITVNKIINPTDGGGRFNLLIGGTVYKVDADNGDSTGAISLTPGKYLITETAGTGTNISEYTAAFTGDCLDIDSGYEVNLSAGENKICTITNTKYAKIVVTKQTVPAGSTQSFHFVANYNTIPGFYLTDGQSDDTGYRLNQGPWHVSEDQVPGWGTTASCDNGDPIDQIYTNPGQTVTCTFTNTKLSSIAGFKLDTTSGTGLSGWVISLYNTISNSGSSTTTGGDGSYSFTDLWPSTYTLSETLQGGWTQTAAPTSPVTLGADENLTDQNFSNFKNVSVTVCKRADPDGNIISREGRTTIPGWSMGLIKNGDTANKDTKPTGANGCAQWLDLGPGNYAVTEEVQTGWTNLTPITHDFGTVQSGSENYFDFINTQYGKIIVKKVMIGGEDDFPFTGNVSGTISTNNGTLVTNNVLPGSYSSVEGTKAVWDLNSITCDDTTNGGTASTGDVGARTATFNVEAGETVTCTFTNTQKGRIIVDKVTNPSGSNESFNFDVTGTGFFDFSLTDYESPNYQEVVPGTYSVSENAVTGWSSNGGVCDKDETPASLDVGPGETVTCTFTNTKLGKIIVEKQTTPNTDSTTQFEFDTSYGSNFFLINMETNDSGYLTPGNYSVTELDKAGWDLSNLACNDPDRGNTINGSTANIDLDAGEEIRCTFDNTQRGSIAGRKYEDMNGDGNFDGGEPYLNGWTIHLFDNQWNAFGQMNTGDTGTLGQYKFTNLVPGDYYICEDLKTGWAQSDPNSGAVRNESYCRTETVGAGEPLTSKHFGNVKLGVIQSRKYEDINTDSEHNDGENWLNGWTIRLYKLGDGWQLFDSMITGDTGVEGQYRFEDLPFGTYYICEVLEDGWAQTDPSTSEGFANLSGAINEAPRCRRFIVDQSGDASVGERHFGNTPLSDIHGYKFNDSNGNGSEDGGEQKLAGWKIFIDKNDDQTWNDNEVYMLTDSSEDHFGWYWFLDLIPGTYSICEDSQLGWDQTTSPTCHTVQLPYSSGENTCGQNMVNFTDDYVPACNFGNFEESVDLNIAKSNNKTGGMSAGNTVDYSITLTNDGNTLVSNIIIQDVLPGGFKYVSGSTTGEITSDPSISGSVLTWSGFRGLGVGQSITIHYQAVSASDLADGLYVNFADCSAMTKSEKVVSCDPSANSTVKIGSGTSFGGSLGGQVLGISTVLGASIELPATGSSTELLIAALIVLGIGLFLKAYDVKIARKSVKKVIRSAKKKGRNNAKK